MDILREIFGHKCYMCHKIIQKGNSAGIMNDKGHICVDCIIKPESGWGDIRTREEYFKYVGKQETREEWNDKLSKLGYPTMSKLKWWIYHRFD